MIEENEMSGIVKNTTSQIENSILGTTLKIDSTSLQLLEYYTVQTSIANGGYSNDIDLSEVVIDPLAKRQELKLPINRTFSNNSSYKIGYLTVTIVDETRLNEEIETIASSEKKDRAGILLTIAIVTGLVIVSGLAVLLFVKMVKKRRFNKNHRNPRIL